MCAARTRSKTVHIQWHHSHARRLKKKEEEQTRPDHQTNTMLPSAMLCKSVPHHHQGRPSRAQTILIKDARYIRNEVAAEVRPQKIHGLKAKSHATHAAIERNVQSCKFRASRPEMVSQAVTQERRSHQGAQPSCQAKTQELTHQTLAQYCSTMFPSSCMPVSAS